MLDNRLRPPLYENLSRLESESEINVPDKETKAEDGQHEVT
jgi:hypothetical protein